MVTGFDDLMKIIRKGSPKNHLNFPHEEVRIFFEYIHPFNFLIYELLKNEEDVTMYQRLLSALQSLEPSFKIEEGKRSSCDIIEVVKYFLEKIDPLLEHKTDNEGKNAVNKEIDTFSLNLRKLCGTQNYLKRPQFLN